MSHLIVGAGNLGCDLALYAQKNNLTYELIGRDQFEYPKDSIEKILKPYKHIWLTTGAGSVEGAKTDIGRYIDLHVKLPCELIQNANKDTRIHLFSSNFVASAWRSLYATSKETMERMVSVANRPNTFVYRVANLYGVHRPENTFPYKLKKHNPKPTTLYLPYNEVLPTPTEWLATVLMERCDKVNKLFYNIYPEEPWTVLEWGKKILGDEYEILPHESLDMERPNKATVGINLPDMAAVSCRALWDIFFDKRGL